MISPDFIIVGAPKCGTTALVSYLSQHPDIYMPKTEVKYYNYNYDNGIMWYSDHFESGYINGEKTASYFYNTEALLRIKKDNPDCKLILLLRNPIDRAYSYYWMARYAMREDYLLKTFDEVLDLETKEVLEYGLYVKYLKNLYKIFSKDQIKIVLFEDYIKNPVKEINNVFSFLNVKPYNALHTLTRLGGSKHITNTNIEKEIYNITCKFKEMKQNNNKKWVDYRNERNWLRTKYTEQGYELMKTKSYIRLHKFYNDDINELERLLNINLKEKWNWYNEDSSS